VDANRERDAEAEADTVTQWAKVAGQPEADSAGSEGGAPPGDAPGTAVRRERPAMGAPVK
jgi:hypothetical protein